jgi:hypothetical protein
MDPHAIDLHELPPIPTTANGSTSPLRPEDFDRLIAVAPENIESEEVEAQDLAKVGKPRAQDFFRVHPTESAVVPLVKMEDNGQFLLVSNRVEHSEVRSYRIHLFRTIKGKLGLWPIATPRNGEDFAAARQARNIAADATQVWVAMKWVGGKGGTYKWKKYPTLTQEPQWPAASIRELIIQAFEGEYIASADDPRLAALPDVRDAE